MAAGDVGAGDPAGALDDARVDEVADAGLVLLPQRARARCSPWPARGASRSRPRRTASTSVGSSWPSSRFCVDLAVAGQADRERLAGAVGVLEHDEHVLEGVAGRPGPVVARELLVEVVDQRLDGRGVRASARRARRARRRTATGAGGADLHGLDVGGVVAVRAADVGVLADLGLGQELLGLRAAHRAGRRLDDDVVEAEPVEDLDVGVAVRGVRRARGRRRRCRRSRSPSSRTRGRAARRRGDAPRRGTCSGSGRARPAGPCRRSTGPSPRG